MSYEVGPFSVHSDLGAYLSDLRKAGRYPLFTESADQLKPVIDSISWADRASGVEHQDLLVLVPESSPAVPLASALAGRYSGVLRPFGKTGLRKALDGHSQRGSAVIVALAGEIGMADVVDCLAAVLKLNETSGPSAELGFVVAPTLAEISWIMAKGLSYHLRMQAERGHSCASASAEQKSLFEGLDVEWIEVAQETFKSRLGDVRHSHVSFVGSGREHVIVLGEAVICGVHGGWRPRPQGDEFAPSCAFTDKCFIGVTVDKVLEASAIKADVLFVNSCMSWRPGSGRALPAYQLTNGFMRGPAAAYIGPLHPVRGDRFLNRIFHGYASAGRSAGDITNAINRYVAAGDVEPPHFAVLGLPWVGSAAPDSCHETGAARVQQEVRLTCRPGKTASMHEALRMITRTVDSVRNLVRSGFPEGPDYAEISDAENRIINFAADLKALTAREQWDEIRAQLHDLRTRALDLQLKAAEEIHLWGQGCFAALLALWDPILITRSREACMSCLYCNGGLAVIEGEHPADTGVVRRAWMCDKCGPILDLPADPYVESIEIRCADRWYPSSTISVDVLVRPSESLASAASIAMCVHLSGSERSGDVSAPEPRSVTLVPGMANIFSFKIAVGDQAFPHNEYFVRALLLVHGMVHYGSREIGIQVRT